MEGVSRFIRNQERNAKLCKLIAEIQVADKTATAVCSGGTASRFRASLRLASPCLASPRRREMESNCSPKGRKTLGDSKLASRNLPSWCVSLAHSSSPSRKPRGRPVDAQQFHFYPLLWNLHSAIINLWTFSLNAVLLTRGVFSKLFWRGKEEYAAQSRFWLQLFSKMKKRRIRSFMKIN